MAAIVRAVMDYDFASYAEPIPNEISQLKGEGFSISRLTLSEDIANSLNLFDRDPVLTVPFT